MDGGYFKPAYSHRVPNSDGGHDEHVVAHECIKGGDDVKVAIAAASLLAKTTRDAYVAALAGRFPRLLSGCDLGSRHGYWSEKHRDELAAHGFTQFHRRTFNPIKSMAADRIRYTVGQPGDPVSAADAIAASEQYARELAAKAAETGSAGDAHWAEAAAAHAEALRGAMVTPIVAMDE